MGNRETAIRAFLATLSREERLYGAHYAHHRSEVTMANVVPPVGGLSARERRKITSAIDAIFRADVKTFAHVAVR